MKNIWTLLLLTLLQTLGFGQEVSLVDLNAEAKGCLCRDPNKFDSLSHEIIKRARLNNDHQNLGVALYHKGYSKTCIGEAVDALLIYREALPLFDLGLNLIDKVRIIHALSTSYTRLSELDSAFKYSNLEIKMAANLGDSTFVAASLLARSGIHSVMAQSDSVIFYSIKGLNTLEGIDNVTIKGSLYLSIGNAHDQNEAYDQALDYYSKAEKYYAAESQGMVCIYHNKGTSFAFIKELDSSFYYLKKAIEINIRHNRKLFLANNYIGLAETHRKSGNCKKSITYNLLAIEQCEKLGAKRPLGVAMANISPCYVKTGQVDEAIASAEKALLIFKEVKDTNFEADSHFLLSKAYAEKGDFEKAYESHQAFYSLDSLLMGEGRQSVIAGLEEKYESEIKESEIENLSQQTAIQALEIKQKNYTLIIGLVMIIFVLAIVYFIYRQRTLKSQQSQTEIQQRFLRSQLNPHFISNALLAVQNFMLKNEANKAAIYLAKFSKLMREILENSRHEFILVEDEIQMLTNYMDIHKLRMDDAFDYRIDIADSIDPEVDTIPPMFVQPFVENAIEHGIVNAKGEGLIELSFVKYGDYISIEIKDNGDGLNATQNLKQGHTSLSTTIIQERMDLFNRTLKNKIKLVLGEFHNQEGEIQGTKVELKVPFSYL